MLYNLARMSTGTMGDGAAITLDAAVPSFLTFNEAGAVAGWVTYAIEEGMQREIGKGWYNGTGGLERYQVYRSTNNLTQRISLSGSAQVAITPAAEDIVPFEWDIDAQGKWITFDNPVWIRGQQIHIDGNIGTDASIYANYASIAGTMNVGGALTVGGINTQGNISGNVLYGNGVHSYGSIYAVGNITAGSVVDADSFNARTAGHGMSVHAGISYRAWTPAHQFGMAWGYPHANTVSIFVDGGGAIIGVQPVCDERMKQDIAPSTFDCLATVRNLPLYEFRWMDSSTPGEPRRVEATADNLVPVGLVAQRLNEVAPSLVRKPEMPEMRTADDKPYFSPWDIDQNNAIAMLTGAIQQLLRRIEALEKLRGTPP